MDVKIKKILQKEGIQNFDKDIRMMSKKELRKHFSFKTKRKINSTNLIKNLIWQAYTWIQDGRMDPVEGNLRSFWYVSVKSVLSRLGFSVSGDRYMNKVYDIFVEMTATHHLFRYADFGFDDSGEFLRVIGNENGNLILFAEKRGLWGIIRRIALSYGITGISLDGFPSRLETEFLVRNMLKKGLLRKPVSLFSVVDYDPSGYWIQQEVIDQLKSYDVEIGSVQSLINPNGISKEKLNFYKYSLKNSAKTKNWMKVTDGINGDSYGLEANAFGGRRIRELFEKAIQPYLSSDNEYQQTMGVSQERESFFQSLAKDSIYERLVSKGF